MAIHINTPPEAKPERISRLVTRLEEGDIKIPVFQRQYVWNQKQVLELLESVYRGYPVGSLLFWLVKTPSLVAARNIGGFELPSTKDQYPVNFVLDGQQRLTTVYGVLRGPGVAGGVFDVCFDLTQDAPDKAFVPTPEVLLPTHLPMNLLFNTRRFLAFQQALLAHPDFDALVQRANVLLETFREYSVPVVTVTEPTVEQVALIFERINSTGTKLTVYDLMIAATWSASFDLRAEFDACLEDLRAKDYGEVSPVAMLQVLAAHAAGSAKKETILGLRKRNPDELRDRMREVREGMRRAVDFLATDLHVRSVGFLPYERQLVVISYVFCKHPRLSAAAARVLRAWFWRTSFAERYRRGGEGLFDEDLRQVTEAFANPLLLEKFGSPPTAAELIETEFRKGAAVAGAFVALLAAAKPRNLLNGAAIDTARALSSYNRKEFHHLFPQAFLRAQGVTTDRTNSLANICMLSAEQNKVVSDRRPSEYIAEVESVLGQAFLPVLESNLIPADAVPFLKVDDYDGFLRARAAYLSAQIGHRIDPSKGD